MDRRTFLKTGVIGLSGLSLAACSKFSSSRNTGEKAQTGLRASVFLHIGPDDRVTVYIAETEMGQGVMTSLAMIAAEELDARWDKVHAVRAPLVDKFGIQSTGGSSSVREAWDGLRKAGATARWMLIQAAAQRWKVNPSEITTRENTVTHRATQRTASYGELAEDAARLSVPSDVAVKPINEFRLMGKPVRVLDADDKARGKVQFGIDAAPSSRLVAAIIQNPGFSGRAIAVDDSALQGTPNFHSTRIFDDFVAVVARDSWSALQAAKSVTVHWPKTALPLDTNALQTRLEGALKNAGILVQSIGASEHPPAAITARYFVPYQAHAMPEPPNASAIFSDRGGEIWTSTQTPSRTRDDIAGRHLGKTTRVIEKIARRLGGDSSAITVHPVYAGGGFGRRLKTDFALQAAEVSKALDAPVQILWSREQDIQQDFYRPASLHQISATPDAQGKIEFWRHHITGPSIDESEEPGSTQPRGYDNKMVEGARNLAYRIPNQSVRAVVEQFPLRCGLWRSVGHSANAFVVESFIDELAHLAGADPLQFRLAMLDKKSSQYRTLQAAAEACGWHRAPVKGHARGIAVHASFGSTVAQVAEISVINNKIRVHKFYCVIDCGFAVNPDGVRAQMEGAVVFGLTAALKSQITLKDGAVAQSNFHDYALLRYSEMPEIETVILPSDSPPQGAGEPGVPPVAPALANAIFAATGKRLRELPLQLA